MAAQGKLPWQKALRAKLTTETNEFEVNILISGSESSEYRYFQHLSTCGWVELMPDYNDERRLVKYAYEDRTVPACLFNRFYNMFTTINTDDIKNLFRGITSIQRNYYEYKQRNKALGVIVKNPNIWTLMPHYNIKVVLTYSNYKNIRRWQVNDTNELIEVTTIG